MDGTISSILQIIIGLPLALFLPGYLLARILFKELGLLEKIALGFVLSIALNIAIGLFLGYNKYMKDLTGGITALNLWIYLGSITIMIFIIYLIKCPEDLVFFKRILKKRKSKYNNP